MYRNVTVGGLTVNITYGRWIYLFHTKTIDLLYHIEMLSSLGFAKITTISRMKPNVTLRPGERPPSWLPIRFRMDFYGYFKACLSLAPGYFRWPQISILADDTFVIRAYLRISGLQNQWLPLNCFLKLILTDLILHDSITCELFYFLASKFITSCIYSFCCMRGIQIIPTLWLLLVHSYVREPAFNCSI